MILPHIFTEIIQYRLGIKTLPGTPETVPPRDDSLVIGMIGMVFPIPVADGTQPRTGIKEYRAMLVRSALRAQHQIIYILAIDRTLRQYPAGNMRERREQVSR